NLTHDHLDYHHTLQHYKLAKYALFDWPGLRAAVVNVDDPAGAELLQRMPPMETRAYSLGKQPTAALQAQQIHTGTYGLVFNLVTPDGTAQLLTRLVGEHNISNLLLVAGVLQHLGWGLPRIARALGALQPVEGRLQIVEPLNCGSDTGPSPMVVVDYAHTPDALERALLALRK